MKEDEYKEVNVNPHLITSTCTQYIIEQVIYDTTHQQVNCTSNHKIVNETIRLLVFPEMPVYKKKTKHT